ncbi:MAG: hypothetical protein QF878_07695 [SAR202 cluster bacterium]|jgi:hypothetical protein|nr:hypothetical protein [Planctomycetota bacterium]MDP6513052.1 hypothetical protein [SAR202 cluster bacterium]
MGSPTAKYRYPVIALLFRAVESCRLTQQSLVGYRDGSLIALALEVYRRKHGQWPASLSQLTPDILPNVPRDRMNGDPLRFRVENGQAVVYSIGQDLDDDGGVVPADAPKHFIEIPKDADERTVEAYRKHSEKLRNETSHEHRRRIEKAVSPQGHRPPSDGDWVLWHTAEWPVEPDASGRN